MTPMHCLTVMVFLFSLGSAQAAAPAEVARLLPSGGAALDEAATSVAINGDVALVGVPYDDDHGYQSGSVYVFERSGGTWLEAAKLTASDAAGGDNFGWSVALSGNLAVIGARYDNHLTVTSCGSAYVFVRGASGWVEETKLTASDAYESDFFGYRVDIDGDTILISAIQDRAPYSDHAYRGAAYVFVREEGTWRQQAKLLGADDTVQCRFGWSLALEGDTALIGAPRDWRDGSDSGAAYLFTRTGGQWSQQAKLKASEPTSYDYFGQVVALASDTAVIGSKKSKAYIFTHDGTHWAQSAMWLAPDGESESGFASAVAIHGDTVVIGEPGAMVDGQAGGAAHVYGHSGGAWLEPVSLTAADSLAGDAFAGSVAFDGYRLLVGAAGADDTGSSSGKAYIFQTPPPPPIDADPTGNSVSERALIGSSVGLTATSTGAMTYSLTDDAGTRFAIDAETGTITTATLLDAETQASHRIQIIAQDAAGLNSEPATFTIAVVDEAGKRTVHLDGTDSVVWYHLLGLGNVGDDGSGRTWAGLDEWDRHRFAPIATPSN